ncbi:GAF domain-containing protein [Natrialba sp. INN-245]|uniref:GAF domain-containing protein n=1 Tax=Natrialba sp. INN-245 TaxID=2690967 RepID=UPI00130FD9D5|nr:GAF domain-containing protein [Natrialba sp. INN-245]MWV39581.1 GAF domain-containing protein [Natrialba sp. INN-245]
MNRSLEPSGRPEPRVSVVGSSERIRAVTVALEESSLAVSEVVDGIDELESVAGTDCLLTDDPAVLSQFDEDVPIVYAGESSDLDRGELDRLLDDGVADVVASEADLASPVFEHRIRRAIDCSSMREFPERTELHRKLLEESRDTLVVLDDENRIATFVPPVDRRGPTCDDPTGRRMVETVHPDDRDSASAALESLRHRGPGSSATVEYRSVGVDGCSVYEASFTNRLDDETLGGIVGSIRDVTAHHHVERELDESFDRITDAFCALDSEWRFTYVNDRAIQDIDLDREELLGRDFRSVFPALDGSELESVALEAMDRQEPRSVETYLEPYDTWIDARIYPSPSGVSIYWRDVTERVEREWELDERTERLEAVIENAPVGVFALDGNGTVTFAEGRIFDHLDVDADEFVGESIFTVFDDYQAARADFRAALDGHRVDTLRRIGDRVFDAWCRPITSDGDVDRVIGIAVDVTGRVQSQEALSALHDATGHLLSVDSKQTACEYIVDVASDVLDLEGAMYRFDEQGNELVPAAHSPGIEDVFDVLPSLRPQEDSITWNAFVSRFPVVFDDVRTSEVVYDESTDARSGLYIPLGEHGVFVAASTTPGKFDRDTVELAQLFATTAETAFDRIGQTQRLHDREHELKRQNEHLERLNETNRIRQEIEQLLLMADSREEIERGLCDSLADLEACSMVWIGTPDPSGSRLETRSIAGRDRGYLEATTVTTVDDSAAEPAGRAAQTERTVYVENVADSVHDGSWRAEALSQNYQSVYAVPLVYDGLLYGVVSLYGDEPTAFDELLRSTLEELAETIAYTIDAVKRKTALLGDDVTEIELEVADGTPLSGLSSRLNARTELEGTTIRDDATMVFVSVDASLDREAATLVDEIEGVLDAAVLASNDDETLLQLELSNPSLGSVVADHGGTIRKFVADGAETVAVVDLPATIDVREMVSALNRQNICVSLTARREQSGRITATLGATGRNTLLGQLTDRQREVVQTAYHSGFFEWPRRTTGEEIADSIGISSPAFHKHVRSTERKLFEALFGDGLQTDDG